MVANLLCLFASECYHTNVVKRVLVSIIINQGGYQCYQLLDDSEVCQNFFYKEKELIFGISKQSLPFDV